MNTVTIKEAFMTTVSVKKFFPAAAPCAALIAALVFSSCMSTLTMLSNPEKYITNLRYWDENLPKEESVELAFPHIGYGNRSVGLTVTSYNGIPVNWSGDIIVFLPPGETVLTVDFYIDSSITNPSALVGTGSAYTRVYLKSRGSSIFTRNFKAGDRFSLFPELRNGKPGVVLLDMGVKKKPEEYEFVPFPEPGKIILE